MMSAGKSSVCAAALLCLNLLALGAQAKGGDGYHQPLAKNANWLFYSFDAQVEVTTTSIRNGTEGGVNSAGTIATTKTKLYDMDDKQIGVGQWVKFVTGDEEGFAGSLTSLFTLMYEFGTIADGYFDSSITAMVAADRLPTEANQRDYDAVITGGTGKFLGATGQLLIKAITVDPTSGLAVSGASTFEIWVPRKLPRPPARSFNKQHQK